MRTGDRQEDPLRPFIFNLVLDEVILDLANQPVAIRVIGISILVLAFVEDLDRGRGDSSRSGIHGKERSCWFGSLWPVSEPGEM